VTDAQSVNGARLSNRNPMLSLSLSYRTVEWAPTGWGWNAVGLRGGHHRPTSRGCVPWVRRRWGGGGGKESAYCSRPPALRLWVPR